MLLDFTDVIEDEDLSTTFDVIRRTDTVGDNGRSTMATQRFNGIVGIVVPGDPGKLLRTPEAGITQRAVTITTLFRLRAISDGVQPDQVVFEGVVHTVTAVKAWTSMGDGFVKAVALSENAADPPPM